VERRDRPPQLSGYDVFEQLCIVEKGKWDNSSDTWLKHWKKRSIFFELPYWKELLLRNNLDVMHIEKNVCDNIIGTIMHIQGKSTDGKKARMDLKEMGIRETLHLLGEDGKIPLTCYMLSSKKN